MTRRGVLRLMVGSVAVVLGLWAFAWEPATLTVREYRLEVPRWRAEHSGLRVAVLGDLHVGSPFNGIAKLRRIVAETNAARPDLVLIPGDLVIQEVLGGRFVSPEDTAAVLADLKSPLGVWATLGNHDWWLDPARVQKALEAHGIRVLEDRSQAIAYKGAVFSLVGITDFLEGPHDLGRAFRGVDAHGPVLVFTHNPDVFPHVKPQFSLLIAAHTHGGQVYLPFLGRPIVPSIHKQRYALGHVIEEGRHLFVNTGLGTSILPVRFRVPPEISIVSVHAAAALAGSGYDGR